MSVSAAVADDDDTNKYRNSCIVRSDGTENILAGAKLRCSLSESECYLLHLTRGSCRNVILGVTIIIFDECTHLPRTVFNPHT